MSADDAYVRHAEELVREQMERLEGPVESVRCTPATSGGAHCEVVLADGRSATSLINVEDGAFVYFVGPEPSDVMEPADLIFMPDYAADPVWTAADNSMVALERLPIAAVLRARIREWAARWEALADQANHYDDVVNGMSEGPATPVQDAALDQMDREGRQLCQELRAELGAPWRVAYATFPDGQHLQWETEGPAHPE